MQHSVWYLMYVLVLFNATLSSVSSYLLYVLVCMCINMSFGTLSLF